MTDRKPGAPGRWKATVSPEEAANISKGEPFNITLERNDEPITPGTPYNKASVLPDELAQKLCPEIEDPAPKDALEGLYDLTATRKWKLDAKAAGWVEQEDSSYLQTFDAPRVTEETEISADYYALVDGGLTVDEKVDISAALGCIGEIKTAEGQITLVCFTSAPEMDLSIVVQEVR